MVADPRKSIKSVLLSPRHTEICEEDKMTGEWVRIDSAGLEVIRNSGGAITGVRNAGSENNGVHVGDTVKSSGRILVNKGVKGVVREILEPDVNGRTKDIIRVEFEGKANFADMKLKDLEP